MGQPAEVEQLGEALVTIYAEAQRQIDAELERISANPRTTGAKERLNALRRRVDQLMNEADEAARRWAQEDLPKGYALGAGKAARFTQVDRSAVQELAQSTYDDLLKASRGMRSDVRRLVQAASRRATIGTVAAGKTARQAAREATRSLLADGISAVTYANGARVGIDTYAQMVVRTRSAIAYNSGTLNASPEVQWWEVFDGVECGWTAHSDPDLANGSIRSRAECEGQPISHPSCRRSFGPRPDLSSAKEAAKATRSVSSEQDQAQSVADAATRDAQRRRTNRRARQKRSQRFVSGAPGRLGG